MGVIFLISFIRNMESKRLQNRLGEGAVILSGYNVHFYGIESVPGIPFNSMGALGLSKDGVYYIARFSGKELFIQGAKISSLSVADEFKGKNMYGKVVVFNYINEENQKDRAAFRIPYPEKWSKAIHHQFMNQKQ